MTSTLHITEKQLLKQLKQYREQKTTDTEILTFYKSHNLDPFYIKRLLEKLDKKATETPVKKILRRLYRDYHRKHHTRPHPWFVASKGDYLIEKMQLQTAINIAAALGYEIRPRADFTPYKQHTLPKIKINGKAYRLTKLKP